MVVFEHTLFMLLLLVGVLNAKPPRQELTPAFILVGLLLAFLPPAPPIPVPWEVILGLTIPLLLWQNARRLANARWTRRWSELSLWLFTALILGALFTLTNYLEWRGAILFGLITASMSWRAVEPEEAPSPIGQIGPLTLVFLLAEIAPTVETPNRYLGGLFSGAAVGIALAYLAVRLSARARPRTRGWITLGQVYLAYWTGAAIDASAIAAAVASVIVYLEFGYQHGLWSQEEELRPAPLNTWPVFGSFLLIFLFLGWQSHQPWSGILLLEVSLGMVIGVMAALFGRWLGISAFIHAGSIWRSGLRVALLLFPALLLWPRTLLIEPVALAFALGITIVVMALSANLLPGLLAIGKPDREEIYIEDEVR